MSDLTLALLAGFAGLVGEVVDVKRVPITFAVAQTSTPPSADPARPTAPARRGVPVRPRQVLDQTAAVALGGFGRA